MRGLSIGDRQPLHPTDPGILASSLDYAPGTWYTEWLMEESPEQARYTASLNLFFIDQEKVPFPNTYVFVPALRRSLRLARKPQGAHRDRYAPCGQIRMLTRQLSNDLATVSRWIGALPKLASPASARRW